MAYSEDLRKRVLDFVAEGGSKQAAAERLNVGLSTVFLWCKTPEKLKAEKPGPKGCSKLDLDRLRAMLPARRNGLIAIRLVYETHCRDRILI